MLSLERESSRHLDSCAVPASAGLGAALAGSASTLEFSLDAESGLFPRRQRLGAADIRSDCIAVRSELALKKLGLNAGANLFTRLTPCHLFDFDVCARASHWIRRARSSGR